MAGLGHCMQKASFVFWSYPKAKYGFTDGLARFLDMGLNEEMSASYCMKGG